MYMCTHAHIMIHMHIIIRAELARALFIIMLFPTA